eukprot:TRINITY_DN6512_c0_g1_i1.p1 TRINITY_DN6512_c0_g1~~TRINITY_DN6512_c0_g1_i1.p1  ORF type:complete len:482 (-),score=73.63 TRINITY_DN6512_c0_g1_i1:1231-2676(-)
MQNRLSLIFRKWLFRLATFRETYRFETLQSPSGLHWEILHHYQPHIALIAERVPVDRRTGTSLLLSISYFMQSILIQSGFDVPFIINLRYALSRGLELGEVQELQELRAHIDGSRSPHFAALERSLTSLHVVYRDLPSWQKAVIDHALDNALATSGILVETPVSAMISPTLQPSAGPALPTQLPLHASLPQSLVQQCQQSTVSDMASDLRVYDREAARIGGSFEVALLQLLLGEEEARSVQHLVMDMGVCIYKAAVLRSRQWPSFVWELVPVNQRNYNEISIIARCVCFLLTDALTTTDAAVEFLKRSLPPIVFQLMAARHIVALHSLSMSLEAIKTLAAGKPVTPSRHTHVALATEVVNFPSFLKKVADILWDTHFLVTTLRLPRSSVFDECLDVLRQVSTLANRELAQQPQPDRSWFLLGLRWSVIVGTITLLWRAYRYRKRRQAELNSARIQVISSSPMADVGTIEDDLAIDDPSELI